MKQCKQCNKENKGKTNIIGDDHAPHTQEAKREKYVSGIPTIGFLPERIEKLISLGIDLDHLEDLLFNNANRILFENSLDRETIDVEYNPTIWDKYGYNPFSRLDNN